MKFWGQLRLLLWKNGLCHSRQKLRVTIEVIWPLLLFLILMWVRTRGLKLYIHECHFDQKAMPSAGFIPFIQSTVCTLNNTCHERTSPDNRYAFEYNTSLLVQLVGDVDIIVKKKLHGDTLMSIRKLSSDLKELSAFVKKVTNPEAPLKGKIWVKNIVRAKSSGEFVDSFKEVNLTIPDEVVDKFYHSSLSVSGLQQIFDRGRSDVYSHLCRSDALHKLLNISNKGTTSLPVQLCNLAEPEAFLFTSNVVRNLNWTALLTEMAGITKQSGYDIGLEDWRKALVIAQQVRKEVGELSSLREMLDSLFKKVSEMNRLMDLSDTNSTIRFVQAVVCGRNSTTLLDTEHGPAQRIEEFREQINQNLQQNSQSSDKNKDDKYLYDNSTSQRCNAIFKTLEENQITLFLWKQLKPYVRGKILYSPRTAATFKVIERVNKTFEPLLVVRNTAHHWTASVAPKILSWMQKHSDTVEQIKKLSSTGSLLFLIMMEQHVNNVSTIGVTGNEGIGGMNTTGVTDTLGWLADVPQYVQGANRIAKEVENALNCVEMNRFEGYDREEDLMKNGLKLMAENKLWAALVFTNTAGGSWSANNGEIPKFIRYKIRMDAQKVDSTKRIEDRVYHPGPRRRPAIDLKYITFGFAYLQDLVEQAIISLHTGWVNNTGVYLQQFPYPCYIFDQFIVTIAESFPMFMVLSWVYSFSMIIKSIVREKELRLKEAMKVMGLSNSVLWTAWFINSFLFMFVSSLLLTLILKFGKILEHSNPVIILLFLMCFACATISKAFMVTTWFSRANIAACAGGIVFFTLYLPYPFVKLWTHRFNIHAKGVVSLISNVAFGLGCSYLAHFEEEGTGVQWSNFAQSTMPPDKFSIAHVMGMLLLDSILYFVFAWYIEAVFPGQYGVPKPWYFFLTKSYWTGKPNISKESLEDSLSSNGTQAGPDFEDEPNDLTLGVSIRHLSKTYSGCTKAAVNNLSLNFYENQITSFLGHNGAGKTTTISILTGLYPPTSGTAKIYAQDIREDMDTIRRSLGVCPQHNVLFDELTVFEHLYFYAKLKGRSAREAEREAKEFLKDLNLTNKRNAYSGKLSGGMQRRLSIAIAFVGGSRTVILDEPTAGVDPYARRGIWELVLKYKAGRTVILTTHHMDEADLLGDRIAVINEGQLRCCGSSLFLKTRFGSGYYLTLVRELPKHLPKSPRITPDDNTHKGVEEQTITRSNGSRTDDDNMENLKVLIRRHIEGAALVSSTGVEMSFRLPACPDTYSSFEKLCRELDANLDRLGVSSYGLSDTTLEEVFLKVTKVGESAKSLSTDQVCKEYDPAPPFCQKLAGFFRAFHDGKDDRVSSNFHNKDYKDNAETSEETGRLTQDSFMSHRPDVDLPAPVSKEVVIGALLHRRQLAAMYRRRLQRNTRNLKGLFCEIILPAFFVFLALLFTLLIPPLSEEPSLELLPWLYGPPNNVFFSTL
ncbi:ATP-binding cassette sub-family A member 7-like isoform X2 [Varroa destructor]|uniref:ABC transporter domain-containing protein n=1 Tax=Varroa destructor TaxID=109461 RepID=A0A7M7JBE0_VARDE|nr:ATP-binding cassette sub-family A member 7-like isoform X2 [Varroa destructor]